MTKTLRALLTLALVAIVAGCGSSGSGGSDTDTAKLAPASSFIYAEATIDPTGDQEAGMRSILGDLPGSGAPEDRLNQLIEQASQSEKNSPVDYDKDVKPWLGDKVAVFGAQSGGKASPAYAVIVATSDEGKAKETIKKGKQAGDRDATYRGTEYVVDKDGTATATTDGFFLAGNEAGVKVAIDTAKAEDRSLSKSDRYKEATKDASDERVALVYEDVGGLVSALASQSGSSLGAAGPLLGRVFGGKPAVATIKAENQALVIDGSLVPRGSFGSFGKSTELIGQVPSDSWLAVGAADFGASLKTMIGLVGGIAGGEQQLEQQLKTATGLDLQQDVLSWIGDVAFFAGGDSKDTIAGGALIQSKNPDASRRALTKLAALAAKSGQATVAAAHVGDASGYELKIPKAPRSVFMLQGGDKVAITYGDAAAKSALGGGSGLADAEGFKNASGKLGEGYAPSLYLSAPPILSLAESFGAAGGSYDKAKPYLTILDYVISGGVQTGDAAKSRTRIGFKPHG